MRVRPLTSGLLGSFFVPFIAVLLVSEADAVISNIVDVVDDAVCSITHVDVWAGVSAFSDDFSRQPYVAVKQRAWIEWSPIAWVLLNAFYPGAQWCADFFSSAWQHWKFQHDVVVTAGPRCCPFSVSGKRLRHEDPRSNQGLETAKLAVFFGVIALIVENVTNFVDEDNLHHLVHQMDGYLVLHGMVAIGV
jgi:site-specific DNA-cytosine methylase